MLRSEGEGDGAGEFLVGDKAGDRREECRGGEGGLADEECLFLVRSLETEAVAWEVLAPGNVGGAKSCGGGRVLELEVEFDTIKQDEKTIRLPETSLRVPDREAESCFSLSITSAWSSMNIFLNDVTAKFIWVSLSEELFEGSSIGGVSGLDGRTGEDDLESGRTVLREVKDLPLDVFGILEAPGPSERVGLVWFRLAHPDLIGEVVEPNDGLCASFLDPSCGDTYDDRMSYARIVVGNSGVRVPALCPLLKLVRLEEVGEGEGQGDNPVG